MRSWPKICGNFYKKFIDFEFEIFRIFSKKKTFNNEFETLAQIKSERKAQEKALRKEKKHIEKINKKHKQKEKKSTKK